MERTAVVTFVQFIIMDLIQTMADLVYVIDVNNIWNFF